MIQFFRRFFQSKVGIAVTLAFLALIAFAFASADVSSSGTFGGVSGGDRVAIVGDEKISTNDLSRAATNAVDGARQRDPTASMPAFIEQGGLEDVLEQVLERAAISGFAEKYGLRAGKNLVNSEIMSIPAFRGADGNFDQDAYLQALSQRGLNDKVVREDLRAGLLAKQVLIGAGFGAAAPDKFAFQYASLLKERRKGTIGLIPSTAFAPDNEPTDAQLSKYYDENQANFIRPERRTIRYLTFDDKALGNRPAPTDEEITAYFEENAEAYAASEQRNFTQLIVSTKAAADAVRNRVQSGGSLETAAREAGLQTAKLGPVSSAEYEAQASGAVAEAAFAASRGSIAAVANSGLGFHVVRVDAITKTPGRTLAQARSEISATLTEQKRLTALGDLAARIEEEVDSGTALSDLAKELKVEIQSTKPVLGSGSVYENPQETIPALLGPALQTAFQMEEGNPQLTVVPPGESFLIFEVDEITPSAAAPLAEVREQAVFGWKLAAGSKAAKAAVDRIMKRVTDGSTVQTAMGAETATLPPVDTINLSREQLAQSGAQVPAPLALLFSMAQGTTKKLEGPQNAGWFVVDLDEIEAGTVTPDDPLFAQTKTEVGQSIQQELSAQLRKAIQAEIGTERNETAIEAVRKQLGGAS